MGAIRIYLLTATAAILWGANFNLAKPVVTEMGPFVASSTRYLIAAAMMVALTFYRKESIPFRYIGRYIALGLMGVFGFNIFFFLGMQTTSAVNGALIMALNPLLTSVLAYLILKDKPLLRQWVAFPIGIIGVAIVVLGDDQHLELSAGDIYIAAASFSWALYNVYVRKLMPKDVSGIASTAGIMTVGAIALTVVALVSNDHYVIPTLSTGIALLVMSVGGGVLAYLFWNAGIDQLGPSRASIFLNLVPVTAIVIAALEGIPPTSLQLIGAILVIGAVSFGTSGKSPT